MTEVYSLKWDETKKKKFVTQQPKKRQAGQRKIFSGKISKTS